MTATTPNLFGKPDPRWIGISYCMFVVYHLLPTLLMISFVRGGLGFGWNIGSLLWMVFGLALVGMYVGYKSSGVTILEPAISSIAYVITLMLATRFAWDLPFSVRSLWTGSAAIMTAIAIVLVSAWIGELLQAKAEDRKVSD